MDFGIARSTGGPTDSPSAAPSADEHLRLLLSEQHTVVGSVVGTVEYMAPEQARAQPVDHRADIYAFGLILYDLLLGRSRSRRTASAIAELNLRMLAPPPSPRSVRSRHSRGARQHHHPVHRSRTRMRGTPRPPNSSPHSTRWTTTARRCRSCRRWTWRMGAVGGRAHGVAHRR